MINENLYWADLATYLISNSGSLKDFLSSNFTIAVKNPNEAAFALSLLDLPFNEEGHGFKASEGRAVEIKAACNMIIFLKEILEAEANINKDLLVV